MDLRTPTVSFSKELWAKLNHWVKKGGHQECSGMGKVEVDQSGNLRVVDAWMIKQKNSGAETEMDADDFGKVMFQQRQQPGSWYFWWHSHASMPCFWSGTDREQIVKLASNGACVALVLNTRGEHKLCLAIGKPFFLHVDDVKPNIVDYSITAEQKAAWDAEFDAKVESKWSFGGPSMDFGYGYGYWGEEGGHWNRRGFLDRSYMGPETHNEIYRRNSPTTAVGKTTTEIARGSLRQEEPKGESTREAIEKNEDTRAIDLAWKRLEEIHREIEILDWALREHKVNRAVCKIINVIHEEGLEMDSEVTGQDIPHGQTIHDEIQQKQVQLFEEEDEIERAIANYEVSRRFPDKKESER